MAALITISYPTLRQDPDDITHSLLSQISQQLYNTNHSISVANPPTQNSFSPSAVAVFINSVWFLSLVLSLTCAIMATLLQQWARRYLQIIQRNHAPHVRAHIREYFFRGTDKFGIVGLAELLPFLLLISVFLFFAGLVGFAFQANHTVAYITLALVAICFLAYIYLTLTPLFNLKFSPNCPYYTSLTSILLFTAQNFALSFSSVLYHSAEYLKEKSLVSADSVKRYREWYEKKAKSRSEDVITKLSNLATKSISLDIYNTVLAWTLRQFDQDHELEEFVAGIPGLYESEAFSRVGADGSNGPGIDEQRKLDNIRSVLAVLPGPSSTNEPLPWSVIRIAQRTITNKLSEPIQRRRTRTCLRALYHIPGAIRDILVPYAAGQTGHFHCLKVLPLLNSPESLEIIYELWNTPNDDVARSVRCAAAVVAAFMITPPHFILKTSANPVDLMGNKDTGKKFLAKRLSDDPDADGNATPKFGLNSDTARLQNIVRFLADIKGTLHTMNKRPWTPGSAESILRQKLFDQRNTFQTRGIGMFDQQPGDRMSPAFVPAVQQDLITLTLEILARDPVAKAAPSQRKAYSDTFTLLEQEAAAQAPNPEHVVLPEAQSNLDSGSKQAKAANSIEMVKLALDPVFKALSLP